MAPTQHACSQYLANKYLAQVIQLNIQLLHLLLDISHDNRLPCMVDMCQMTLLSAVLDLIVSLYRLASSQMFLQSPEQS